MRSVYECVENVFLSPMRCSKRSVHARTRYIYFWLSFYFLLIQFRITVNNAVGLNLHMHARFRRFQFDSVVIVRISGNSTFFCFFLSFRFQSALEIPTKDHKLIECMIFLAKFIVSFVVAGAVFRWIQSCQFILDFNINDVIKSFRLEFCWMPSRNTL